MEDNIMHVFTLPKKLDLQQDFELTGLPVQTPARLLAKTDNHLVFEVPVPLSPEGIIVTDHYGYGYSGASVINVPRTYSHTFYYFFNKSKKKIISVVSERERDSLLRNINTYDFIREEVVVYTER